MRYYETTKTAACVFPLASVSLARGVSRGSPFFAHARQVELGGRARTLLHRCRPCPVLSPENAGTLPASQDTPICLCPAHGPRPGPHTLGPRASRVTSYFVHGGTAPLFTIRKARTFFGLSGFYYAALALAPYASCGPRGRATQCSLPSGCQPFSGGSAYPLGIDGVFHFSFIWFLFPTPW